jgi:DnaK suppressor protein
MARKDALLRLYQSLVEKRAELGRRLGVELNDMGHESSSYTGDSADAAFDTSGEEIASQLAEFDSRELMQIERALKRLRQGSYGYCEGCSQRIPVARLNALPYSTLCIQCQREMENDDTWLDNRAAIDWDKVSDSSGDEPRDVDISDLEMDISK